jgi:5-methylcytosine-specific restriction endonuclease McrA
MICDYCGKDHDGKYASGRFCGSKCSRGFATQAKREEINRRVSVKMKGRIPSSFARLYLFRDKAIANSIMTRSRKIEERYIRLPTEQLSRKLRRKKVIEEQGLICGQGEKWQGRNLALQLDHIDGNSRNNQRENLRALCPNCHSQTITWGNPLKKDKFVF